MTTASATSEMITIKFLWPVKNRETTRMKGFLVKGTTENSPSVQSKKKGKKRGGTESPQLVAGRRHEKRNTRLYEAGAVTVKPSSSRRRKADVKRRYMDFYIYGEETQQRDAIERGLLLNSRGGGGKLHHQQQHEMGGENLEKLRQD